MLLLGIFCCFVPINDTEDEQRQASRSTNFYYMKQEVGRLKVLAVREKENTCEIDFEVDDIFISYYLKHTGKKRVTSKGISRFITKVLKASIEETDGYRLVQQTKP